MSRLTIEPARSLRGELLLPGDKSISHRTLLVGALCAGSTRIHGLLKSGDTETSRKAIEALGARVREEAGILVVEGVGLAGFKPPAGPLDMGNSGTTTRLLLGILAGHPFSVTLTGDDSLSKRPMGRVTEPLIRMGAKFEVASSAPAGLPRNDVYLPLTVRGGKLRGIRYSLPVPSAQVKSALLLAGLHAQGPTTLVEPVPTRDHTERLLRYLGAKIEIASAPAGLRNDVIASGAEQSCMTIQPGSSLQARELTVPGDFSSAAFFLAAAAIVPGSWVTLRGVGLNPTRTGFLDLLRRMGAKIGEIGTISGSAGLENKAALLEMVPWVWEPVGDLTVEYSPLRGVEVGPAAIPNVIDELPILMVVATQAEGKTRIEGAGELRVKETDRIHSMVTGLALMGARIRAQGDSIEIEGPTALQGAPVQSFGDHRTAMALAVAALCARGETLIGGTEWVEISFPGFFRALESIRR